MKPSSPHQNMSRYARQAKGFSLIEVMIAMLILTIGIFALYSLQITSIRGNNKANVLTVASTWATDQVEYLLSLDYNHPDLDNGDHGPVTREQYNIQWTVQIDTPLAGSKSIIITVSNLFQGANHNYQISCIKGKAN